MKATYQQRVIHEAVSELGTHPKAEDVYDHVAKVHPTISRATVFRNLTQLAEAGKLLNIGKIDGVTRYDHNCHHHYHFECRVCKRIFDVDECILSIDTQVESPKGFYIEDHVVYFRGVCKVCYESNIASK
ncbi:MAG: transcriptional repressor [Defluviitaleaceae bacterium]|nr:transcriptional repressor [Defluviitaleaceae bacterium]